MQINRRELFKGSAATALALTFPSSAFAAPATPPSPVRLGATTYCFYKFDPAKVIEMAKQLRTPYLNVHPVHIPSMPLDEVRKKADAFRAAGFVLTATGTIYFPKDEDDDIRAKFEYVKAAGIPMIIGGPSRKSLARVEKFAKEYDIRVAVHNHGPEDKEWASPLDVLEAIKDMDSRVGCCIDLGHTMRCGVDVVDAIKKAGPRLFDLHMKDLAQSKVRDSQVAVGEGLMPVAEIFRTLIKLKYKGFVDLEYEVKPNDPLPGVLESFAYMRGVLTGMGYSTVEKT